MVRTVKRVQKCKTEDREIFKYILAVLRNLQIYLGTEAIKKAEPDVHQGKGSGFIQEVTQKAADAVVRPLAMDQQQSAQEAKLC